MHFVSTWALHAPGSYRIIQILAVAPLSFPVTSRDPQPACERRRQYAAPRLLALRSLLLLSIDAAAAVEPFLLSPPAFNLRTV